MPRPLRIMYPDAWYHVMNRGRRGELIFESKDDYKCFLGVMLEAVERFALKARAYCLMPNHYHLSRHRTLIWTGACGILMVFIPNVLTAHIAWTGSCFEGDINQSWSQETAICKCVGDHYHIESYSTVSTIIERLKIRLKSDRSLKLRYSQLKKNLMGQKRTLTPF